MKVFISWSGELSKQLAAAIHKWLPSTLQYVKPYFTPEDVQKGAKWDTEISKELELSRVCVIALTRESLDSPWVMFEAGAISRGQTPVCAILFDLESTDIQGPLERFQATKFSEEEMYRLLKTINSQAGDRALDESVLNDVFRKWWPDLEKTVAQIIKASKSAQKPENVRDDRSLLEEAVFLGRTIHAEQAQTREWVRMSSQVLADTVNALRMGNVLAAGPRIVPGVGLEAPTYHHGVGVAGGLLGLAGLGRAGLNLNEPAPTAEDLLAAAEDEKTKKKK